MAAPYPPLAPLFAWLMLLVTVGAGLRAAGWTGGVVGALLACGASVWWGRQPSQRRRALGFAALALILAVAGFGPLPPPTSVQASAAGETIRTR
jgi:hypothetical protein